MAEFNALVKQVKDITFTGKADSNHWVPMDGPEEFGGSNAGTRPKELLLLSLGGCTGSDVASMLKKMRIKLDDFDIKLKADVADEHPKVFKSIHIEYIFTGDDIDPQKVEKAVNYSQTKYCAVTKMLEATVEITHSYKIVQKEELVNQ